MTTCEDSGQRLGVLVVDDHEDVRFAVSALVEAAGYRVWQASNAAETVELMRRVSPDLLLLDYLLGSVSGVALLRELRGQGFETPCVLMTALNMAHRLTEGSGISEVLVKPFSSAQLCDALRKALP